MKAEIVGVGTELLLGQIANTNAQRISEALASIGVDVHFHVAVGDNLGRMADVIATAVRRSEAVVITGGLGPTPDDITREGVAEALGLRIDRHEDLAEKVRDIFGRLNRPMPEDNLKQADLPEGAVPIEPEGTAPGFYVESDGAIVFALPGVPWEMEAMLKKTVLPVLRERQGDAVIVSRHVLVIGLGESHTQEKIADIVDAQTNPTIAYLAGGGQVRVRITAKARGESEALALIRPVEAEIRSRLGRAAVEGEEDDIVPAFGNMMRERGISVAVAESLTGGLMGAALSRVKGSSDFFLGGLILYATEMKERVGDVDRGILEGPGAVSAEAAAALAESAAKKFDAGLGLSATGVAGPSEQEGKPVGTVFVGASYQGRTETRQVRGYGDRENIRKISVTAALDLGRRLVLGDE
ncbi:MAG: nicotinamide-nucleotide amidase [Actinomycetota bacterium]|nr:nicotinamide-nucleotide amidase [Actinomycetota bacterium]